MTSAVFSNDGTNIMVSFDTPTNKAELSNNFPCSRLFSFSRLISEEASRCLWLDNSRVAIFTRGDGGIHVGDAVQLTSRTLRAQCRQLSSGPQCSQWDYSQTTSVVVAKPANPLPPSLAIVSPAAVGPCDDLSLDLSGSRGSGGRSFVSVKFSVEGSHANVSRVAALLNNPHSPSLPYIIPYTLLAPGYAYNIVITLCNFIGGCTRGSHSFVVSASRSAPVVSLISKSVRTMNRYSELLVSGRAYTSQCGSTVSTANLEYSWKISFNGLDKTYLLPSTSADPRVFKLPPFSLDVGSIYTLTLTARHTESLKASSSSVLVAVVRGEVVAQVKGSSQRGLRSGGSLLIDASFSYDKDNGMSSSGVSAGLTFGYSCVQISPSYKEVSDLVVTAENTPDRVTVSVPSGPVNLTNSVHKIIVTVTDSAGERSASAAVTVTVLPSFAPLVSVVSDSGTRINPSQKLKLLAQVDLSSAGEALWSIDDPAIDLNSVALSQVRRALPAPSTDGVSRRFTLSLVLPQDVLPQQASFLFQLSVTSASGHTAAASIAISTNSPPLPGEFLIDPTSGVMVSTPFTFSASKYEDDDIPISYEFAYQSPSGSFLVFRSRLEKPFAHSVLPAGRAEVGNLLSTRLHVFDTLDAKVSSFVGVAVSAKYFSAEDTRNFLTDALSNSNGYADEMKQAVAMASSILNAVDCSGAPDCAALNRKACSTSAGQCGTCNYGYAGEFGHANSRCVEVSAQNRRRLQQLHTSPSLQMSIASAEQCADDTDCAGELWSVCSGGECVVRDKECVGGCVHGECKFVSLYNTSIVFDSCTVLDGHCRTVCECKTGFRGRSCELSQSEHEQALLTRHQLAETIRSISLSEDATADTLVSWLESLASICSDPSGLEDRTKVLLSTLAEEFLRAASALGLPYEAVSSVSSVIDLVLSTDEEGDNAASLSLLTAYNNFVLGDMVEGQNTVSVMTSTFRASHVSLSSQESTGSSTVSAPTTALEDMLHAEKQSAQVPVGSQGGVKVSVVETLASSNNKSSYLSIPLGLRFDTFPCDDNSTSPCLLTVTLQNVRRAPPLSSGSEPPVYHSLKCEEDVVRNQSFTCPEGDAIWLHCNGTAGYLSSRCPMHSLAATCASIGSDDSVCSLVHYRGPNVTCECSLLRPPGNNGRRLQATSGTEGSEEESVSVDFATISVSIATDFVDTWKSAGDLSAQSVKDGVQVLITVALIGIFAVSFVLYAAFLDHRDDLVLAAENASTARGSVVRRREESSRGKVVPAPATSTLSSIVLGIERSASMLQSTKSQLPSRKLATRSSGRGASQVEREKVETALPAVLRPLPIWKKFSNEVKMHHRWVGVVCHYSPAYSRPLRVMSLLMNILTMLFIDSLTYEIAYPDDGSCETYSSAASCLREDSAYAKDESKCFWDESDSTCHIQAVENDMERVIFVAIIAAIISTPFAVLFQSLILFVLSAETIHPNDAEEKAPRRISASDRGLSSTVSGSFKQTSFKVAPSFSFNAADTNTQLSLGKTFSDLMNDVRNYRELIPAEKRKEFDSKILCSLFPFMLIAFGLMLLFRCMGSHVD
jgi:hypothetical protein